MPVCVVLLLCEHLICEHNFKMVNSSNGLILTRAQRCRVYAQQRKRRKSKRRRFRKLILSRRSNSVEVIKIIGHNETKNNSGCQSKVNIIFFCISLRSIFVFCSRFFIYFITLRSWTTKTKFFTRKTFSNEIKKKKKKKREFSISLSSSFDFC